MTRGLWDGFEGFRTVTEEQQREAVGSWLVVLDTNVLLNLYTYSGAALDDFFLVFEALGDRLFVPHQVMHEFWNSRNSALSSNRGKHRERQEIADGFSQVEDALAAWHRRMVARSGRPPADLVRKIETAREEALAYIDGIVAEVGVIDNETLTQEDPVLRRLESLLQGKVGDAPSTEVRRDQQKEAEQRIKDRVPPGFMDADKEPERATGDFFVWRQAMERAQERGLDLLLVTDDNKDDWWFGSGATRRAHPSLVSEMLDRTSRRAVLMRAHGLLGASAVLGVSISKETVEEAEEANSDRDADAGLTENQLLYRSFWGLFAPIAKERGWSGSHRNPPATNWWSMPAGGSGYQYSVSYAMFGCRSELYIGSPDREANLARFRVLEARRDQLQEAFGEGELIFDELPQAQACRIEVRIEDGRKVARQDLWHETVDWLVDTQARLRHAIEVTGGLPTGP